MLTSLTLTISIEAFKRLEILDNMEAKEGSAIDMLIILLLQNLLILALKN